MTYYIYKLDTELKEYIAISFFTWNLEKKTSALELFFLYISEITGEAVTENFGHIFKEYNHSGCDLNEIDVDIFFSTPENEVAILKFSNFLLSNQNLQK